MNENLPVGIIDSGVGGLTALLQVKKLLADESIVYVGDSERMPYGNLSSAEIVSNANEMISFLEQKKVKVILLACNTISANISSLKSSVKLISVVKAGARALAKAQKSGKIGMIATCATVKSGVYEKELKSLNPDLELVSNSSALLPKIIDSELENINLIEDSIKKCVDPILSVHTGIDKILLGCTHFPIIKKEISRLYPSVDFIDPAGELVIMLKDFLCENSLSAKNPQSRIDIYTTAESYEYAAAIKRLKIEIDTLSKVKLTEAPK